MIDRDFESNGGIQNSNINSKSYRCDLTKVLMIRLDSRLFTANCLHGAAVWPIQRLLIILTYS
jgi:hypothetical protein